MVALFWEVCKPWNGDCEGTILTLIYLASKLILYGGPLCIIWAFYLRVSPTAEPVRVSRTRKQNDPKNGWGWGSDKEAEAFACTVMANRTTVTFSLALVTVG